MSETAKEIGFTKLKNNILENLYSGSFSSREIKVILAVLRFTIGFHRDYHSLSVSYLAKATNIHIRHIKSTLNGLIIKEVIIVENDFLGIHPRQIKINNNVETWKLSGDQKSTSIQSFVVTKRAPAEGTNLATNTGDQKSTQEIKIKENIKIKSEIAFERFWNMYDKKISKEKCTKKWSKLSLTDKEKIFSTLPKYLASTPDKQYRKNPETYLNNKSWEDEISSNNKENSNLLKSDGPYSLNNFKVKK